MIGLVDVLAAPVRAADRTARWITGRTIPNPNGLGAYCQAQPDGQPCDNFPVVAGRTRTGDRLEVCAEHDWLVVR